MQGETHFLISMVAAICGEHRLGLTVTRDQKKVTCDDCKRALSMTTLINPDAVIDPPQVIDRPPSP